MDPDELARELLRRRDLDQEARKNAPGGRWTEREREKCRAVDADNTRWLAALVAGGVVSCWRGAADWVCHS